VESEPAIDLVSKRPRNSVATTIGERLSEEIVIALSRPAEIGQHWLFVIHFPDLIRRVDHGGQISFDGEC
jgi:hypothetical protein